MKSKIIVITAIGLVALSGTAFAQQQPAPPMPPASNAPAAVSAAPATMILAVVPAGSLTLSAWQKQNVYDMAGAKIGDISDVLVSPSDGKITAVIIGVGGFLGMGEKEVAVSFGAIRRTMKDNKSHLVMNTTKEALTAARGLKFDRDMSTWIMASTPAK